MAGLSSDNGKSSDPAIDEGSQDILDSSDQDTLQPEASDTTPTNLSPPAATTLSERDNISRDKPGNNNSNLNQRTQFQSMEVDDALLYVDRVKREFENDLKVYKSFLDVMSDFKSHFIDTEEVIRRVSNLFKGHRELIDGFNVFLPPAYWINVEENEEPSTRNEKSRSPRPPSMLSAVLRADSELTIYTSSPIQFIPGIATSTPISENKYLQEDCLENSAVIANESMEATLGSELETISSNVCDDSGLYSQDPHCSHCTKKKGFVEKSSIDNEMNIDSPVCSHEQTSEFIYGNSPEINENVPFYANTQTGELSQEGRIAVDLIKTIKDYFKDEPEKYSKFLECVRLFVKQQNLPEGADTGQRFDELKLYEEVSKLFEGNQELLSKFSRYLPVSFNQHHRENSKNESEQEWHGDGLLNSSRFRVPTQSSSMEVNFNEDSDNSWKMNSNENSHHLQPHNLNATNELVESAGLETPVSFRDISLAEVSKFGSMKDHAFFGRVRKALKSQQVYDNFLRCLMLFNQEVVSRGELVDLVMPFLGKFPELFNWFKKLLNYPGLSSNKSSLHFKNHNYFPLSDNLLNQRKRSPGEFFADVGGSCSRVGVSYCALPKNYEHAKCTGRTPLCHEVLNDTWVSFPSWSEGSTFVTLRKSLYEEYLHQCEDERFELDLVLEINASTIRVLEGVLKKLNRMNNAEMGKFKLTDCLGGSSPTIHQRAIKQIYGDKAADIIEGLKKKPSVAVPVVLRRLKAKDEEWRTAQKEFNKTWREQNEKYYLRSLDHQATSFKQNDLKALRSKTLFNEIETLFDERHEQMEEGDNEVEQINLCGPHLALPYKNVSVLADAADLLVHYVNFQGTIIEGDKKKIISLLKELPRSLFFSVFPISEKDKNSKELNSLLLDENERTDVQSVCNEVVSTSSENLDRASERFLPSSSTSKDEISSEKACEEDSSHRDHKKMNSSVTRVFESNEQKNSINSHLRHPDEWYSLFFGNNNWYLFIRLHQILCERLAVINEQAVRNVAEESKHRKNGEESVAKTLLLKPTIQALRGVELEDYYPTFLNIVKNLLNGSIDNVVYEDTLRQMFGIHAYIAFTLDKVVSHTVRHLVHLVSDESSRKCVALFHEMSKIGATGRLCITAHQRTAAELMYQKQAIRILQGGSCFKIVTYKKCCSVTIELLDTDSENCVNPEVVKWSDYVDNFANDRDLSCRLHPLNISYSGVNRANLVTGCETISSNGVVFLLRNIRTWWGKLEHISDSDEEGILPEKKQKTTPVSDHRKICRARSKNSESGSLRNTARDPVEGRGGLVVSDSTQCRFNFSKYRMVYVANKDKFLYRRGSLERARDLHPAVSSKLYNRFVHWYSTWVKRHVSKSQQNACVRWFMGQNMGTIHRTQTSTDNDVTRPPYRPFTRYYVGVP